MKFKFKEINWALVLVLLAVAVGGGVIAHLLIKEKTTLEGDVEKKLAIGSSNNDETDEI